MTPGLIDTEPSPIELALRLTDMRLSCPPAKPSVTRLPNTYLQLALNELITRDAEFRQWLATLWEEISRELPSHDRSSKNIIHGDVRGTAVQARDIHGGLRLNRD
jgi:hypothetical protein